MSTDGGKVRAILCFGDSNTRGYLASSEERLGRWHRWPGVAQRALGVEHWYLIEDGLSGRTTMFEYPGLPGRNGAASLPESLELHGPLDAIVIALGTNDVLLPGITAAWAASGVETLCGIIRTRPEPDPRPDIPIIAVVPPPFLPLVQPWGELSPEAVEESTKFSGTYREMAERAGIQLVDLRGDAEPTPLDGIHFEAEAHAAIGSAVAVALRATFGEA
jgi:lysophospholipase L1-like esterase